VEALGEVAQLREAEEEAGEEGEGEEEDGEGEVEEEVADEELVGHKSPVPSTMSSEYASLVSGTLYIRKVIIDAIVQTSFLRLRI
jgi:hypothetical protein